MIDAAYVERVDRAQLGVLGHVTPSGRPNALAVTPYVIGGRVAITSTLALVDKAAALRADPRVTLTAGGLEIVGTAAVQVDPTPEFFDRYLRQQELAKYPPARSLLSLPFHRRSLGWYVGRVVMWIDAESVTEQAVGDRATVTRVDRDGRLRTRSVPVPADPTADELPLPPGVGDGPALLLVHDEDPDMRDLRQFAARGVVRNGVLRVTNRRGTLAPTRTGTVDQLRSLRFLAGRARANRSRLADWPIVSMDA
jgi:hypothetical protein